MNYLVKVIKQKYKFVNFYTISNYYKQDWEQLNNNLKMLKVNTFHKKIDAINKQFENLGKNVYFG